jgi:hypothetical protein
MRDAGLSSIFDGWALKISILKVCFESNGDFYNLKQMNSP